MKASSVELTSVSPNRFRAVPGNYSPDQFVFRPRPSNSRRPRDRARVCRGIQMPPQVKRLACEGGALPA